MSKSVLVGDKPTIQIETVAGDLSVVGWDGNDLLLKGSDDEIRFTQTGESVSVSSSGDLSLRVPRNAAIELTAANGDVSIRGVSGRCDIKETAGDLAMRDVGAAAINKLHGDFSLRGAQGDLYVKNALGDVSIRGVNGNIRLDSVADDLALRDAHGGIKANVGEDAIVYLEPQAGFEYSVNAGDDILLVLPKEVDAALDLRGDRIFVDWQNMENNDETERVVILGDGAAKIHLSAGGETRVSNRSEAGDSADEWGNFAGLNFDWSGFGEHISRQVKQATTRAMKRAEEAASRAERHAARHAQRATGRTGRWNWDVKSTVKPPAPPEPPSQAATAEERLSILKMLADKKITAQQAEDLLNALDGGE